MPTNEERREVAARLRAVTDEELRLCFTGEILYGCLANRHCLDSEGNIDEYLVLQALADLIEPEPERTCNVKHWNNASGVAFTRGECSECGGYLLENIHMQKPHPYCPHCGAKVVQE